MADIPADFELTKKPDKYRGRIDLSGFTVRYTLEECEDDSGYKIRFTGRDFYKALPKKYERRINLSFLEGVMLCLQDYQKEDIIRNDLGIVFLDEQGKKTKNDWDTKDYEMVLKISKKVKRTIRKAYIKKINGKY